jgi:hypothetical protein
VTSKRTIDRPRPETTLTMTESPGEVTRADVERLWSSAIEGLSSWDELVVSAVALIERANSESPVVNWGLLDFYYLSRTDACRAAEALIRAHARGHAQLAEFDVDPTAWMRSHFQKMLAAFAKDHSRESAVSFGRKLVAQGHLSEDDVAKALDQ